MFRVSAQHFGCISEGYSVVFLILGDCLDEFHAAVLLNELVNVHVAAADTH